MQAKHHSLREGGNSAAATAVAFDDAAAGVCDGGVSANPTACLPESMVGHATCGHAAPASGVDWATAFIVQNGLEPHQTTPVRSLAATTALPAFYP
jgi:hypothetical protein